MKEMEPIKREYIERHETAKAIISAMKGVISPYDVVAVAEVLRNQPAADVVEVVRCKDCVFFRPSQIKNRAYCYWHRDLFETLADDFCSHGERSQKDD